MQVLIFLPRPKKTKNKPMKKKASKEVFYTRPVYSRLNIVEVACRAAAFLLCVINTPIWLVMCSAVT